MGEGWGEGDSHRTKAVSSLNDLFAGPGVPNRRCRLHRQPRAGNPDSGHTHANRTHTERCPNRHRDPFPHVHAGSFSNRYCSPYPNRVGRGRIAHRTGWPETRRRIAVCRAGAAPSPGCPPDPVARPADLGPGPRLQPPLQVHHGAGRAVAEHHRRVRPVRLLATAGPGHPRGEAPTQHPLARNRTG